MRNLLVATCLLLAGSTLQAQAYHSSVASVDSIIATLYSVISGNAGEERNWDKFHYLFAPQARLIATSKHDSLGFAPRIITPAEYAERMGRLKPGFVEVELSRRTETYGTLTHVWSTYATMPGRGLPVNNRGINSIQLLRDNHRYYVLSIVWCSEDLGFPLPEKYCNAPIFAAEASSFQPPLGSWYPLPIALAPFLVKKDSPAIEKCRCTASAVRPIPLRWQQYLWPITS